MTIALIVACADSFYIVSDTLCGGDGAFTINTRKTFVSQKHRIGFCIAGDALLRHAGVHTEDDVLYVGFVIEQFFMYIDSIHTLDIDNLRDELRSFFLNGPYALYWAHFQANVSYFYGGFTKNPDGSLRTAIYQHYVVNDIVTGQPTGGIHNNRYRWTDTNDIRPCFFANTNVVQLKIDEILAAPGTPVGMTAKILMTQISERAHVLTSVLPRTCLAINMTHTNSIGQYLHYDKLEQNVMGLTHSVIKYRATSTLLGISCKQNPQDTPPFKTYRSIAQSNQAFINRQLVKYATVDGGQLAWPTVPAIQKASFIKEHPYLTIVGVVAITVMGVAFFKSPTKSKDILSSSSASPKP